MNIQDVAEQFASALIGTSTTAGTGNFVLSGTVAFAGDPNDTLVDGKVYFFHRYYSDMTTPGFEWGFATYDSGSNGFVTKTIQRSSHADGVSAITWTSDPTNVGISASQEMMTQYSRVHSQLGVLDPLFFAFTGQSNLHVLPYIDPLNDPDFTGLLEHWSGDQEASNDPRAGLAWRPCDMTGRNYNAQSPYHGGIIQRTHVDNPHGATRTWATTPPTSGAAGEWFFDTTDNNHPYKSAIAGATTLGPGQWESQDDDALWLPNMHPGYLFAGWACLLLGRKGKIVANSSSGTLIDHDAYGWLYRPGSGNTADRMSTDVAAAAAADPDLVAAGITHPHWLYWQQGELDASPGSDKSAGEYAVLLSGVIDTFYDPDGYDVCKENFTIMIVNDYLDWGGYPTTYPSFKGQAIAVELNRDKCVLLPTSGIYSDIDTFDGIHLWETGGFKVAQRLLNIAVTNQGGGSPVGSAGMTISHAATDTSGVIWTVIADQDTAPGPGLACLNIAHTYLFIAKENNSPGDFVPGGSFQYGPLRRMKPPRDGSSAGVTFGFIANMTFDLVGQVEDWGDRFALPVDNVVVTVPTGFALFIASWYSGDYGLGTLEARATLPIAGAGFEKAQAAVNEDNAGARPDYRTVRATPGGKLVTLPGQFDVESRNTTIVGAVLTNLLGCEFDDYETNGQAILFEALCLGQNTGDATKTVAYRIRQIWRAPGTGPWVADQAMTTDTLQGVGGPTFNFANWTLQAGTNRVAVQCTGVAAQTWKVKTIIKCSVLDL